MRLLPCLLFVLLPACEPSHRVHANVHPDPPHLVSILVEVYDPVSNFVWENVSVRVLESDQEWSGCTCSSPYDDRLLTDANGRVLFDEYWLADAEVGFVVDDQGRAVLSSRLDEDEATVVLEVSAPGFQTVIVEVPLRWDDPDVFVEVPFD